MMMEQVKANSNKLKFQNSQMLTYYNLANLVQLAQYTLTKLLQASLIKEEMNYQLQ